MAKEEEFDWIFIDEDELGEDAEETLNEELKTAVAMEEKKTSTEH